MVTVYRVRYMERVGEWVTSGKTLRFSYHATREEAEAAMKTALGGSEMIFPLLESRKVQVVTEWEAISSSQVKVGRKKQLVEAGCKYVVNLKDRGGVNKTTKVR